MAEKKIRKNWVIVLLIFAGIVYAINAIDALAGPEKDSYEFLSFEINRWLYVGLMVFFAFSLTSLGVSAYKEKRNASKNS
ncbi:hypothetical protein [Roseivirga misakiensis]|uniref:DUF3098 domain-containing protein n=1 Tax=Roseivirga misakiensis TaxID=1563681 RepID=A0A1E5T140_9BACT|nr:hypothetical protein [Roseivirga misakiensis]OEK05090.1 hypothetical protein BFP71_16870 [Roseivirga misakiensis]